MEKRTLEELILKYELEPSLFDIYVEGDSDVCCINIFLDELKYNNIGVFEIGFIDIPSDFLEFIKLENNNRGRVIALSQIFLSKGITSNNVLCLIDRDFDNLLNVDHSNDILYYTDYSCMEAYIFDTHVINKFVINNYSSFNVSIAVMLDEFYLVLQELFLIRCANKELGWNLLSYDFLKQCNIVGNSEIVFDSQEYVKRYLNKNNKMDSLDIFIQSIEKNRSCVCADFRNQIHGHDFMKLFFWYLSRLKPKTKDMYNEESLWKTCFLCLDIKQMTQYNFFKAISECACSN